MLPVMTYFLNSKIDPNSLREPILKCFTLKHIMTLSWRKQTQRQNLVPHSLEDNGFVYKNCLSAILLLTIFFRPTCPEWLTYFKQLLFTYYMYSSSSIFSLKITLLALTFHYIIVKFKVWPFSLQVSQAIRTNTRANVFRINTVFLSSTVTHLIFCFLSIIQSITDLFFFFF